MSIIFITHKLNEVLEIADRVTVLRRGKKIETLPTRGRDARRAWPGSWSAARSCCAWRRRRPQPGDVLLEVEDLTCRDDRGIEKVRGVSFDVRAGEIVGIAGVDGNGQSELIDGITGLRKIESGHDHASAERSSRHASARDALEAGVGHIPEDRQRRGLVLDFSIAENIALHDFRKRAELAVRLALPEAAGRAGAGADPRVRRARRRPADAGRRALRRQPAEGRSSRARSTAIRRC